MKDEDRPLLLFDSGVGGLSVLRAVTALLPQAPLVYVADNGGFPYGTKTEAEIATLILRKEWLWGALGISAHVVGSLAMTMLGLLAMRAIFHWGAS